MHLVGRTAELETVRGCLEDAAAGRPTVLFVRGEAGIGKTQLLSSLVADAEQRRFDVRVGHATEHERDSALALFRGTIDLPALDETDPEARWQHLETTRLVLSGPRPTALVLDDVHWADAASLELVEMLLRRSPRSRHLVALGLRPGRVADRLLSACRSAGAPTVLLDVAPLGHEASDELLGDAVPDEDRARMIASSGGNPLYLCELGRSDPRAPLPDGLVAAVVAELAPLGADATALARAGSLLGDPFDFDIARDTAGLDLERALGALDELAAQRLVHGASSLKEFGFRHPVVRSAIYEGQTPAQRLLGHARAAVTLASAGRPLADQARHLAQSAAAGDATAAATLRAAAARMRVQAPTIAADWLIAADRAVPSTDRDGFSDLAEVLVQSGRLEEALTVAENGVETAGDGADLDRLDLVAAAVERQLGRHDASRRRLERALLRGGLADEVTIALAVSAFERGDYAEVATRAAAAHHAADPLVRACATALLAVVLRFAGDASASEAEATAAVAAVRTATDRDFSTHAELTMATSWALLAVERFDDALSVGRLGSQAARSAGNLAGEVPLLLAEVLALGLLGRTAEAAEAVDRAELAARMSHSDQSMQWALWMRAWVLLDRDELDDALRCAQESVDLAETLDDSALVVIGRAVLGSVLLAVGRAAEAVPLLAAYDVDPGWTCRWAPRLVEAQLAVGDREAAEATASRATRLSAASGLAGPLAGAALARSMLAVETEALREAESAIRHASSIGADLDRAQGHLLAGRAAVTTDREAALAHLESARELALAGGARRAEAAATFELRRLGRRVGRGGSRSTGAAGVSSLSAREREVAELVARGLTNRQIAAQLFLSEKTIEAHLSRAFTKLGVAGRAALAAAVSAPPATDG